MGEIASSYFLHRKLYWVRYWYDLIDSSVIDILRTLSTMRDRGYESYGSSRAAPPPKVQTSACDSPCLRPTLRKSFTIRASIQMNSRASEASIQATELDSSKAVTDEFPQRHCGFGVSFWLIVIYRFIIEAITSTQIQRMVSRNSYSTNTLILGSDQLVYTLLGIAV